jgi:hypothetical protein
MVMKAFTARTRIKKPLIFFLEAFRVKGTRTWPSDDEKRSISPTEKENPPTPLLTLPWPP